ncbi:unnamed protein product [Peronospora belbahrii]|uniref:Uncharacterized protein n=1 Tax=Peronospora belbahrii TaxID=622444 RepID=A0ABN8DCU2_9STRA|nr:unnamed protein product [Peronospora belbahrii]
MKAPDDTKSVGPLTSGPLTWSEADVTMAYHRLKHDSFLESDPVTKALEIRLLGQLSGPVSTLPKVRMVADAITALVTLLREAGMVAGRFKPENLVSPGFNSVETTSEILYKRFGILMEITPLLLTSCDRHKSTV